MSNDIKKTMENIKNTFKCDNPNCKNDFQDNRYGKGRRVFTTKTGTNASMGTKMCTACGKQGN